MISHPSKPSLRNSLVSLGLAALLLVSTVGCGSRVRNSAAGGAGGAVLGGGIGAGVGALIANGDVAASALLGAGIGLPAGIILGLALSELDDEVIRSDKLAQYRANQLEIMRRERQLEILRDQVLREGPVGNPPSDRREHIHLGPSLGNVYR